jgi:hypothetical protein
MIDQSHCQADTAVPRLILRSRLSTGIPLLTPTKGCHSPTNPCFASMRDIFIRDLPLRYEIPRLELLRTRFSTQKAVPPSPNNVPRKLLRR